MKTRPKVVAFDVVETLFALEPLRGRLRALGLPGEALAIWFARLLRNAFALDAAGTYKPFGEVARGTLEALLAEFQCPADALAIDQTLSGFGDLPVHDDVAPAFQLLRDNGVRIIALTNGSADITRGLFQRARLARWIERVVSIDEVHRWKPSREVYLHAAKVVGVAPNELALVAAHAWDVHGASRAGLVTGWVSRLEKHFLPMMNPPDATGDTLVEVIQCLLAFPRPQPMV
jgi:2-haloacid dehalogenase